MLMLRLMASFRRTVLIPLGLSLRQATHEWASALCQCFALSAVVLPILLLIGLKNGLIESEKQRIMNDPDALMLSPIISAGNKRINITTEELADLGKMKGVRIALPQLAMSYSRAYLQKPDSTEEERQGVQITLTRENDISLTHYQCPVPTFKRGSNHQEAVLNDAAAQLFGGSEEVLGKEFILAPHVVHANQATPDIRVTIIGVLPPNYKSLDEGDRYRIFLSEELGFELMDYVDGFPCAFSGEKLNSPPPLAESLLLVPRAPQAAKAPQTPEGQKEEIPTDTADENAEKPAEPVATEENAAVPAEPEAAETAEVSAKESVEAPEKQEDETSSPTITAEALRHFAQEEATAFKWHSKMELEACRRNEGEKIRILSLPEGSYLITPRTRNGMSWIHMSQAKNLLPALQEKVGEDWFVYPWNRTLTLHSHTLFAQESATVSAPWNDPELLRKLSELRVPGRCILYTGTAEGGKEGELPDFSRKQTFRAGMDKEAIFLSPSDARGHSAVVANIYTVPGLPIAPPHFLCAPEDLSALSLSRYKEFSWDYSEPKEKAFYLTTRQFRFRCYAKSLNDVAYVQQELEKQGFEIKSSQGDIAKYQDMGMHLENLLLLLGSLSGTGAIIALAFNLFNATERRKKDYAILRTLGLGRVALLFLPIYETALIMTITLLLSFGIYHGVNLLMLPTLSEVLPVGASLCSIPPLQQVLIALLAMLLAVVAALISSIRLCRLSPAAYIRES